MPNRLGSTRLVPLLLLLGTSSALSAGSPTRQVFVTSTIGTGDLSTWAETESDGLAGADEICQVRAAAAGLANSAGYRAWISTTTTDAFCHLFGITGFKPACGGVHPNAAAMGPWARRDGSPFAAALDKMVGAQHEVYQPVLFDETGVPVPDFEFHAWTGTDDNGVRFADTCLDWTSADSNEYGDTGVAWMVGSGWTYDVSLTCDENEDTRIYCFETGQGEAQKLPSESGALVFVSSVAGSGKLSTWADTDLDGVAGGDEVCRARATAGKLPNPDSFVAWLSDADLDAKSRITDGPYVRVDGFLFAPTMAAITSLTPDLRTGLNVDEFGHYYVESTGAPYVWTGTGWDGNEALDTCNDWTSDLTGDFGEAGSSATTRYTWSSNGTPHCSTARPIYCFSTVEILFWDNFERGNTSRWSNGTL